MEKELKYLKFAKHAVDGSYRLPAIQTTCNNHLRLTKQYSVQHLENFLCNESKFSRVRHTNDGLIYAIKTNGKNIKIQMICV